MGVVLVVSGAAWSTQAGIGVPGAPPVPPPGTVNEVVEGVLAVPGDAVAQPANDDDPGGAAEEAEGAGATHEESDDARAERAADTQGSSESRDAYIARTCDRILGQPATGGLETSANLPSGSTVFPGDGIEVRLNWNADDWSGDELHKALDCVAINGDFVLDLTSEERPAANNGFLLMGYTIPGDVVAGDEICNQGFISGDTAGGDFGQERSNQICFTVGEQQGSAAVPAPATPVPAPAQQAPAAPSEVLGEQLTAPAPAPVPVAAPAAVAPAVAAAPAPEVQGDTLPRTGRETSRSVVLAGIGLTLGGLGMVGGNRRPRRAVARTGPA